MKEQVVFLRQGKELHLEDLNGTLVRGRVVTRHGSGPWSVIGDPHEFHCVAAAPDVVLVGWESGPESVSVLTVSGVDICVASYRDWGSGKITERHE